MAISSVYILFFNCRLACPDVYRENSPSANWRIIPVRPDYLGWLVSLKFYPAAHAIFSLTSILLDAPFVLPEVHPEGYVVPPYHR
jgi:hypothetical protein